jgi:hypothetical protein
MRRLHGAASVDHLTRVKAREQRLRLPYRPALGHTRGVRVRAGAALIFLFVTACGPNQGPNQGQFSAELVSIHAADGRCVHGTGGSQSCPFDYRVRITNPTDRDGVVRRCFFYGLGKTLPVAGSIPANATMTLDGHSYLPYLKAAASALDLGNGDCPIPS